jgi:hypothetical protein
MIMRESGLRTIEGKGRQRCSSLPAQLELSDRIGEPDENGPAPLILGSVTKQQSGGVGAAALERGRGVVIKVSAGPARVGQLEAVSGQCASVRPHHRHRSPDRRPSEPASTARSVVPRGPRQHDVRRPPFCASSLKTAETTTGTMPSKTNEGMNDIMCGSTLRTPRIDF